MLRDPVSGVALAQFMQQRQEFCGVIQTFHGKANHVHELSALALQISFKQPFEFRVEIEQAAVEQRGCRVRNGLYFLKAGLY